jgi:hypothetical protein
VQHDRLKQIVESLAIRDTKLPPSKRLGFERIFREYGPKGYTMFFRAAAKHWPVAPTTPAPPVAPPPAPRDRPVQKLACVVELASHLSPPSFDLEGAECHHIGEHMLEIVLTTTLNRREVYRKLMTEIAVRSVHFRPSCQVGEAPLLFDELELC